MGRDNHPKERCKRRLERKEALIQQFDRILIVSEGSKTEPNYFNEIMKHYRVPTGTYCILPSQWGTSPKQVVEFAHHLFLNGDSRQRIKKLAFERIYAVFDRDDHESYHEALILANNLGKKLVNDNSEKVLFQPIVSVPSFEIWLLSHFKLVDWPVSRNDVLRQLKKHIPEYEKGKTGYFEYTRENLKTAIHHSKRLAKLARPHDGSMPYTDIGTLVEFLMKIKG